MNKKYLWVEPNGTGLENCSHCRCDEEYNDGLGANGTIATFWCQGGRKCGKIKLELEEGSRCKRPPKGWACDRGYEHEGPCAAYEI